MNSQNVNTDKETEEFMLEKRHEDISDVDTEKKDQGLPIDRGWAWAILAGVALYLFLFGAVRKNFGLFFVAFQERYNINASVTSLVATIQNVIISVASLLIMTVGMHYMSNRTSVLVAGIVKTVATITATLSTDVRVLFFSIGILDGIGISLAQNPVISMMGEYFLKRRGLANGLAFCAAATGALVFAPILTTLFKNHGYVGTMLVAAGMSFNTCVTGMLLRPIASFQKKKRNKLKLPASSDDENARRGLIETEIAVKVPSGETDPPFHSLETIPKRKPVLGNALIRMNSSDPVNSCLRNNRTRTLSENSQAGKLNNFIRSLSNSKVALYGSSEGIGSSAINVHDSIERVLSEVNEEENRTKSGCCHNCKGSAIKVFKIIFDASLFKTGVFPCILLLGFMLVSGGDCCLIMLPPHMKDIGLTNDQRGILMLVFGCCDLFSRIILTVIADSPFIKRTTILMMAAIVLGTTCHFLRFFTDFGAMLVFVIITGCCSQLYWALHAVILADYLSLARLKSSLGFMTLCHGLSVSVVLPIAGAVRDHTGNYIATYHLLGTILLIGAAMAFLVPIVDRRVRKELNLSYNL